MLKGIFSSSYASGIETKPLHKKIEENKMFSTDELKSLIIVKTCEQSVKLLCEYTDKQQHNGIIWLVLLNISIESYKSFLLINLGGEKLC